MNDILPHIDVNEILAAVEKEMESADYVPADLRRTNVYDFRYPKFINETETIELIDKFKALAQYFQKDFYNMTRIDLNCSLFIDNENYQYDGSENIEKYKNDLDPQNYIKEYRLADTQLFIQVDPVLINQVLMGRNENTDINPVTKRLANQYFFNVLKELLSKFSRTTITEPEINTSTYASYLQTAITDNIIDNPKHIVSNRNYDVSTYKMVLQCVSNNIKGYISFEFDWEACLKFLGYTRQPIFYNNQDYYNELNLSVTIGGFDLEKEAIDCLAEGNSYTLSCYATDLLKILVNNEVFALAETVQIENNFGVIVTEVLEENTERKININESFGNTFVVLGSTFYTDEDIINMGEGTRIQLDTKIGDYFLLVHNNKIIAMGDIEMVGQKLYFKVAKLLDKPLYFKSPTK